MMFPLMDMDPWRPWLGPRPSKPIAKCSFCEKPIFSEAEKLPNPTSCSRGPCEKKWKAAREEKTA